MRYSERMRFTLCPLVQYIARNGRLVFTEGTRLRVKPNVDCFGNAKTKILKRNTHDRSPWDKDPGEAHGARCK